MYGYAGGYPRQIGGGESKAQMVMRQIGEALGSDNGGAPAEEFGLEWIVRWSKAEVIGAVLTQFEAVIAEGFIGGAELLVSQWEEAARIFPNPADGLQTRALRAATKIATKLDLTVLSIERSLQNIDPTITIDANDIDRVTHVWFGKAFGDRLGGPTYGPRTATEWPGYSDSFMLNVRRPGPLDVSVMAEIDEELSTSLPSWVDYRVYNQAGFYLDGGADGLSLLDLTAFS